jgi:Ran GTPase-activating protein 1
VHGDFGITQVCLALKQSGCPLVELDVSTNEVVYKGAVAGAYTRPVLSST